MEYCSVTYSTPPPPEMKSYIRHWYKLVEWWLYNSGDGKPTHKTSSTCGIVEFGLRMYGALTRTGSTWNSCTRL